MKRIYAFRPLRKVHFWIYVRMIVKKEREASLVSSFLRLSLPSFSAN